MYVILAIIVVALALLYLLGTRNYDYWEKKGVIYEKPFLFLGNGKNVFLRKTSASDRFAEVYRNYPNERFVGYFNASRPVLVLRDVELIKAVLQSDFNNFYSRGIIPHREFFEPMIKNLFFADGDLWKLLRQKMTPAFTSGKLKAMFPLIIEKAEKLEKIAAKAAISGEEVDMRESMARYTTDFIGAVAFGIDGESLDDENSLFRKVGRRIFEITKWDMFRNMFKFIFPETFKKQYLLDPMIEKNIMGLLRSVMKQRGYKPSSRNDFIDQLMELKEKGKITVESLEHRNADGSPKMVELELDEYLMAGQMFVFFAAGFETSSSATSFTLHQLAFHPDAQRKCQQEIDEVLRRHDNQLCYDAVKEMKYLDWCFKEGMRMFPSLGFLKRRCEKKYHVPGTNFSIDRNVEVIIPVQGIQNDEKHFEQPEKFIPERFHPDNRKFHKFAYLPFGEGPRACIGERLGHMQSLAGLAALLRHHSVEPSKSTLRVPIPEPATIVVQSIRGGIPLKIVARTNSV